MHKDEACLFSTSQPTMHSLSKYEVIKAHSKAHSKALSTEGGLAVLNQTIDKLKKNIARLQVEKTQLQERVHKLSADKTGFLVL
jgi:hypothetical protein